MTKRLAWIGCGRHAEQMLLPQITRHDVEIVGVCDINESAARATAKRYGVPRIFTDYRDLLDLAGVDVVGMAVGPKQHRDFAVAALAKGHDVFMEKPCGANLADAKVIEEAAAAARRIVGVGFMKRYSTANRIAHNVVKGEDFGKVAGLFGEYMTAPSYFQSGETVDYSSFYLHHCIHYMDLVAYLVAPVEAVTVFRTEIAPGKLLLHVHFDFVGGSIGTVLMGTIQSRGTPVERLQVMGDHRRVEVDGVIDVRYFRNPPFKADDPDATLADGTDTLSWKPNFTAAANEDFKGYHAMFTAFFAKVNGAASDMPTIAEGVRAMAVLEAMIAGAAQPGTRIEVAGP
ncbi:Gfo/Idh/MocA family oxidoreductase [Telmatospirillum sp.]|uniref:Gfo/Idh/MocA family protein n=1 Tax=Telmatospirillum sp. TaxID=2079197 RepID=UPI002841F310|nr:Gfo/Idh/MocA family oxidoreductase [Telmatospirillum sp.]MDR3438668.1 Gfo/Idh/MocA family oxidoreductase [Telmatospirillum sp.]